MLYFYSYSYELEANVNCKMMFIEYFVFYKIL